MVEPRKPRRPRKSKKPKKAPWGSIGELSKEDLTFVDHKGRTRDRIPY